MKEIKELTAIMEREGDGYVTHCPECDIASQEDFIGVPTVFRQNPVSL